MDEIVTRVFENLPMGRIASWPSVAKGMMHLVAQAPTGHHLEIGVLHGGTLIMAALVKEAMGQEGFMTIGLDPLDGYYPPYCMHPRDVRPHDNSDKVITNSIDGPSNTPVSLDVVYENVRHFGLEGKVLVIQDFSIPWPEKLFSMKFATAYIDGDHYNEAPLIDWMNVSQRIVPGGIVWFDDYSHCVAVRRACEIAERMPGWEKIGLIENHVFALRRVR